MAMVSYPGLDAPATPRVTVCIANYNGAALLPACLDSVFAQDTDALIEVIVHDDASHDDSVALLRARWPQVHVIASEENVGFCIGNNRMVAAARGEYVLLLNNDAALHPDAIRQLLAEAGRSSRPALLTLPQYDWDTNALVDRGCLLDPFFNPVPNRDAARNDVAYGIGACLWCPRDTWFALGGFPEWMESISEDLYLCGLARLRDIPVRALAVSGYRHRQGTTFGGNRADEAGLRTSKKRRRLSERNKTRALYILTPGDGMWLLLATHLLLLALEGFLLSLVKQDRDLWQDVYWPALSAPVIENDRLSALRNDVQATRVVSAKRWFATTRWRLRKLDLLVRHGVPDLT